MLTQEGVGRRHHRPQVERVCDVPDEAGEQRVGLGGLEDEISVGAARRGTAGVEPGRGCSERADDYLGCQLPVDRALEVAGVHGRIDVGLDDLTLCVNPRIGPSRANQFHAVAAEIRDGAGELPGHRALSRLACEAAEPRTVIGDDHAHADGGLGGPIQLRRLSRPR